MAAFVDIFQAADADAETVICSAGLGGVAGYWAPQLAALRSQYRVVTYDQAGTGRNRTDLPADHSIAAMADEALSVLDASGTRQAHFVGHALGGLVGLELGLRRPDRLRSLTIVNGWAAAHGQTRRCFEARLLLLEHGGAEAYVRAQPIFLYPADWLARNQRRVEAEEAHGIAGFQGAHNLRRRIAALLAYDARSHLAGMALPTFVVATRDDILVPSCMSEELAAAIPGARLHVEPWGAHGLNVTEPEIFNALLMAFLNETSDPGPA